MGGSAARVFLAATPPAEFLRGRLSTVGNPLDCGFAPLDERYMYSLVLSHSTVWIRSGQPPACAACGLDPEDARFLVWFCSGASTCATCGLYAVWSSFRWFLGQLGFLA